MKSGHSKTDAPDKNNSMAESIEVKIEATDELIGIKRESGIKLEPVDDVDTIEYIPRLPQFDKICVPKVEKVEKVEPHDVSDEVVETSHLCNQLDRPVTDRTSSKIGQSCSSQLGKSSNESNKAAKQRGKELPIAGPSGIANKAAQKTKHNCSECGYVAPTPSKLERHMLIHTGEKPFQCTTCAKQFPLKHHLQYHMKVHVTKDSLNCSLCWQIFVTDTEKLDHESSCEKRRYECHLCKKFTSLNISHMKMHMRVHNGVRPYKCDECSMKFTQKGSLNYHMKTHTNSRTVKFRCSVCARLFLKQSEKDAHELNCKRRRYECYLCKSYKTNLKPNLQVHMRVHHTGERPFKCASCTKCFSRQWYQKSHMKRCLQP